MKQVLIAFAVRFSSSSQVDEMLYDLVSAKMCSRLSHMQLLEHPAVEAELAACQLGIR